MRADDFGSGRHEPWEDKSTSVSTPAHVRQVLADDGLFMFGDSIAVQVDRAMELAGPTRTVLWVNTHVARTGQPPEIQLADQRNSAWVNLQLADAQRRHPNLRTVRWAEYLAADPSRLATHLSDGVLTTVPQGQHARNELVVQAVERAGLAGLAG